jgi:hypothetical protein
MTRVVAALASSEHPSADGGNHGVRGASVWERSQKLTRKAWAVKLELLELLWPDNWTDPRPFLQILKSAGDARNRAAHSVGSPIVDVFLERAKGVSDEATLQGIAEELPWSSYNTRNRSNAVFDVAEAEKNLKLMYDLDRTTFELMIWSFSRRHLPLDAMSLFRSVCDHPTGLPRIV